MSPGRTGLRHFTIFGGHEVGDLAGVLSLSEHEDARDLGNGFELQNAGHDRMSGKVPLEIRLIDGHVFRRR